MNSNLNKVLFPKEGYTKLDIIQYYYKIAPLMLPHLMNRPLAMQRWPNGINGKSFFQKNKPLYFPEWIANFQIKDTNYVVCNNKDTLIYLANQAVITFHTWTSQLPKADYPTKMVFDLDPSATFSSALIIEAATLLRKILESLELKPYLSSSGSMGAHITVPLKPIHTFEEVRDFAKQIAELVVNLYPNKFTLEMGKTNRNTKLYIDIYRNSPSQLAVAPYSVRALDGAPVAAPMDWKELKHYNPRKYNIKNIFQRKVDPWKDITTLSFSLEAATERLKHI